MKSESRGEQLQFHTENALNYLTDKKKYAYSLSLNAQGGPSHFVSFLER